MRTTAHLGIKTTTNKVVVFMSLASLISLLDTSQDPLLDFTLEKTD